MVFMPMGITRPGDSGSFAHPGVTSDARIIWDDIDGEIFGPIHASKVSVHGFDGKRFVQQGALADVRVDCYLTESRFAYLCRKYDKGGGWVGGSAAIVFNAGSKILAAARSGGKVMAGHIRYPWVSAIQFQTSEGMRGVEGLRLHFKSDGVQCYVEFVLDKATDSARLAHALMERVVAYRRADTDELSPEEGAKFDALISAGPLSQPSKGKMATYTIPTCWAAGGAEQYQPVASPSQILLKRESR